ncbi:MAG: hypothetical protein AABY80_09590 [Candidatus Deferrimicrobiota bacterium]
MKIRALALAIWFVALALAAAAAPAAEPSLRTGFVYDWWKDTKDGTGRQAYIPVRVEVKDQELTIGLLSGIQHTQFDRAGQTNRTLSSALDTKVTSSYAILGKLPVDVLLGLDLNLPTGKTNLAQEDLVLLMDPELVSINGFGEGFNVNPSISVAKAWENWIAGLGVGYAWRGKYDFSTDLGMKDFEPGDIVTANAVAKYGFAPGWSARFFGSAAWYRKETAQGAALYREGDFYAVGAGLDRSWENTSAGVTLKSVLRRKSRITNGSGGLSPESNNIHGDEWWVLANLRHQLDGKTTLSSDLTGLLVAENGYPRDSTRHVGKRWKVALGVGVARDLGEGVEAGLSLKGFTMHDDEANFPQFRSARSYRGASAVLSLGKNF